MKEVLDGTSNLLDTGNNELGTSKTHQDNFSKLLANTRTPGADSNEIYDFFAHPLATKDVTETASVKKEKSLNLDWLPALLGGTALGGVGMFFLCRKK